MLQNVTCLPLLHVLILKFHLLDSLNASNSVFMSFCNLFSVMLGGAHPKKTSRYTKIGILALVFLVFFCFLKFPNWHWFFFDIGFGQHSKLETSFWAFLFFFLVFFWDFLVFLAFDFRVRMTSQKKPKKTEKNQKKPVATPKLVNWLSFFWFFWFFLG